MKTPKEILDILDFGDKTRLIVNGICDNLTSVYPDIKISYTHESEFLLFIEREKDHWVNLLIDEEGDVEILIIPKNRSKIRQIRIYHDDDDYSPNKIVQEFKKEI